MDAADHLSDAEQRPAKRARVEAQEAPHPSSPPSDSAIDDDLDDLYDSPAKAAISEPAPKTEAPILGDAIGSQQAAALPGLGFLSSGKGSRGDASDDDDFYNDAIPHLETANTIDGDILVGEQSGHSLYTETREETEEVATAGPRNGSTNTNGDVSERDPPKLHQNSAEEHLHPESPSPHGKETADNVLSSVSNTKSNAADETDFMAAAESNKGKAEAEWQFDSSDAQSSSDGSSSVSDNADSSGENEEVDYELLDPEEQARILMLGDADVDDRPSKDNEGVDAPKTTHELPEPTVQKPNVVITNDMTIVELGTAEHVVHKHVIIKGTISADTRVLETGSVLCLEDRTVIGAVAEPLGLVQRPHYSVAFNGSAEIDELAITKGTKIFYVPSHSKYVFTESLRLFKGSDASNQHDEEVGEDEIEFSDDEAEAEHKRRLKRLKLAKKGILTETASDISSSTATLGRQSRTSYPDVAMNYDDDEGDEFYTPLRRPENLNDLPQKPMHDFRNQRGSSDRSRGFKGRGRGNNRDSRRPRGGRGNFRVNTSRGGGQEFARQQHSPSTDQGNPSFNSRGRGRADYSQNSQQHQKPNSPPLFTQENYQTGAAASSPMGYGYTAPFWNATSPMAPFNPSHFPNYWSQSSMPTSPGGSIPPGAFVNPAFFRNQVQQQQPSAATAYNYPYQQGQYQYQDTAYGHQAPFQSQQDQQRKDSEEYDPKNPLL